MLLNFLSYFLGSHLAPVFRNVFLNWQMQSELDVVGITHGFIMNITIMGAYFTSLLLLHVTFDKNFLMDSTGSQNTRTVEPCVGFGALQIDTVRLVEGEVIEDSNSTDNILQQ